jgi:carbamoylphosphate synthase large subunit
MKVLLLAQWNWHGPARLPKALKQAGCQVATICKKGDWASLTQFTNRFFYVDTSEERSILDALDKAMREWRPDIVMPGSDNMVKTVMQYRRGALAGTIQLDADLQEVLRKSLVDPEKESYLRGKLNFLNGLSEMGIPVPPQRELYTFGDADAFVQEHGYPVIVKPDEGFAGVGVELCETEEELLFQLKKLLFNSERKRCAIQKALGNKTATIHFAALNGKLLAANCIRRLRTHPGDTGPTSVARVVKSPAMRRAAEAACELVGYNGLGSVQFMVEDEACENAYAIELNARFSPFIHLGGLFGADLVTALVKASQGERFSVQPPREGLTVALYPHEVLRDKDSEFLQGIRDNVDDDPKLAAEYSRLIQERWPTAAT